MVSNIYFYRLFSHPLWQKCFRQGAEHDEDSLLSFNPFYTEYLQLSIKSEMTIISLMSTVKRYNEILSLPLQFSAYFLCILRLMIKENEVRHESIAS